MDAKDFIMGTPSPPQQRAADRGRYVPSPGMLNLKKALGPEYGKRIGPDAKAWNNAAHKLGVSAQALIAAWEKSGRGVKGNTNIPALLLSGDAVLNTDGKIVLHYRREQGQPPAPEAMPDHIRARLLNDLRQMRGESLAEALSRRGQQVPESKAHLVVDLLLGEAGQNRYNPKGLAHDRRGVLRDKWGRERHTDWEAYRKKRKKASDVLKPYSKGDMNPMHNAS